MGLYLCVFSSSVEDDEIAGVEVGGYDDFHAFREAVAEKLEGGKWGSRFPVLMLHHDSDGIWSPDEAQALEKELTTIEEELARFPSVGFEAGAWQAEVARSMGVNPTNLAGSFIDVDGERLLDRFRELTRAAVKSGQPIVFQ